MLGTEERIKDIPATQNGFMCPRERAISSEYLETGYVIEPVLDHESLILIQNFVAQSAATYLGEQFTASIDFLNELHNSLHAEKLNSLRVHVISALMGQRYFREHFYHMAKNLLDVIVGNELVMQKGIGLSVQLPKDNSSLLNVHSDTWSGDSPFEVVVWLPLVDCFKTKSMFICTKERSAEVNKNFVKYQKLNNNEFIKKLEPDLTFLDVPFGSVLVFNQNQLHGNVVNEEKETRWTMNCRFKSAFSPYCDKKLGEFFEPINLKPASLAGMNYVYPNTEGKR